MRRGDSAFLPCRVNAPGCAFQPWPGAAALQHLQQPREVAKPQLKQGLQTSVTSHNFTMDLFVEPPPLSGQTVIMGTSCFNSVPDKGSDGASNREKHRS